MREIAHFIAMPSDLTDHGLVASEPFKCATPASAIERAKGCWKVFRDAGAIAFVRTGYPKTKTTVLRRFGTVPFQDGRAVIFAVGDVAYGATPGITRSEHNVSV